MSDAERILEYLEAKGERGLAAEIHAERIARKLDPDEGPDRGEEVFTEGRKRRPARVNPHEP